MFVESDARIPVVRVGIGEAAVVSAPARLRTSGLGSCVCVVLYDLNAGVAGLAHIILPVSPPTVGGPAAAVAAGKYADLAVPWLYRAVLERGGSPRSVRAKYAGGARMFPLNGGEGMQIGARNVQAVEDALRSLRIPVMAADVGGTVSRTVEFNPASGKLWVRTAAGDTYVV